MSLLCLGTTGAAPYDIGTFSSLKALRSTFAALSTDVPLMFFAYTGAPGTLQQYCTRVNSITQHWDGLPHLQDSITQHWDSFMPP
jgi:hypothetical protein